MMKGPKIKESEEQMAMAPYSVICASQSHRILLSGKLKA